MMYLGVFYTLNLQPTIVFPFYQLPQIYNLKFPFWDQYFWWSKVVKLGPMKNQTYEMSKATFAHFSRFCLLLWSPETVDFGKSNIFIK